MKLLENDNNMMRIGEIGVYIYTFSLMISKAGINIGLFLMLLGFIGVFLKKKVLCLEKEEKVFILFFLMMPIFSFLSPGGFKSFCIELQKTYRYLGIFLIPLFIVNKNMLKKLSIILSVELIINFVNAMRIYKSLNWNLWYRYSSFGGNTLNEAHMLAMLSMFMFVMFVYSLKDSKNLIKILRLFIFLLSVVALIMSKGRGAWLAAIAGFIIILLLFMKENKKIIVVCFIIICGFIGISKVESFQNNQYVQRIKSITDTDNDASNKIRLLMWEGAINIYKKHPVFGVGRDSSPQYYLDYFEKNDSYSELGYREGLEHIAKAGNAHNMYFTSLAESGLMLIYFVGMFTYIFYKEILLYLKSKDDNFIHLLILGLIGMLVAFCVGGLTENSWQDIWKSSMVCWSIGIYLGIKKNILKIEEK